ncbi:MAG: hypothetical protein KGP14_03275 [Betaproteobacteria bacterium]|nr:hypothetical protein [Betaproteobacteria bacterium]
MAKGGKRKGAGRKAGSLARATIEQKSTLEELARAHTDAALNALVRVATTSTSDAAVVSASSALLDRGYGKPKQSVDSRVEGNLVVNFTQDDAGLL